MDPRDLEHVIALYDGEIRLVDEHRGLLRRSENDPDTEARLRALGYLE